MKFRLSERTKELLYPRFHNKKELFIMSERDIMKSPVYGNAYVGFTVIIDNDNNEPEQYMLTDPTPYTGLNKCVYAVDSENFNMYWRKLESLNKVQKMTEEKFNNDYPIGSLITFKDKNESESMRIFGYITKRSFIDCDDNTINITINEFRYNGTIRDSASYSLLLSDTEFSIATIDDVYKFLDNGFERRIKSDKEQIKLSQKNIIISQKERTQLKKKLRKTIEEQTNLLINI